jgi:septal ring factor EnvC (AmiA/AmiB activator)
MQNIEMVLGIVLGSLSIAATAITAITFFGKLRWEVDALKKENSEQRQSIERLEKETRELTAKGSVPTGALEKRINSLEESMKRMQEDLVEIKSDLKALLLVKTGRRGTAK